MAGFMYLLIFLTAPTGAADVTPFKMFANLAADSAVALLFYDLFRPMNKRLSLVASLFRAGFVIAMALNALNFFGFLDFLPAAGSPASFNRFYGLCLIPFGFHCVLTGYLIRRSTFLPRILGVLMMVAGLAYLLFLGPSLGDRLFFPYIAVPAVVAEGSLTLWLLIMGVSNKRWSLQGI
jgi:Domain of unknown function (DUF4386)